MCKNCELNPVYEFTNKRKVCGNCFVNYFNKKVLYTIRRFKMADHSSVLFVDDSGDFRGAVLTDVLKMFVLKSGAQLAKKKGKKVTVAVGDSTDIISSRIIDSLFEGDLSKVRGVKPCEKGIIRPLYLMLDGEILLYAKLKKLKFKQTKNKEPKFDYFVNAMEKKHPELKHSVVNSYLELFVE